MAEIVGVHGIKGTVKLKVFSDDPKALASGAPLCDSSGKTYKLKTIKQHGNIFLADIDGLTDRTPAEKLRGTKLFISRDALPELKSKNTYYHADLIGMIARRPDGSPLGNVINVLNFGAGDILEIKPPKGDSFYVPFSNKAVPKVDIDKKEMTVDPPEEA